MLQPGKDGSGYYSALIDSQALPPGTVKRRCRSVLVGVKSVEMGARFSTHQRAALGKSFCADITSLIESTS
jgi:hypothetical protein